jgi:hypothetical protein
MIPTTFVTKGKRNVFLRHVMHVNKVYTCLDRLILDLAVGLCVRNTASGTVVAARKNNAL